MLLGKTESEGAGDPWPVIVPGEEKPVSSAKIGEYITSELLFYHRFYLNTKHCGPPFSAGWTSWPPWVPQLIMHFDNAFDAVRCHNERMAYKQAGVR